MNNSPLIPLTGNQHQYMYSDTLQCFLYAPRALKIAMEKNATTAIEVNDYYMRK